MNRITLTLLLMVLTFLLGGCAPHVQRPLRDASRRIVINYWNGFTGPDGNTMKAMVTLFEKENPDIEVRMQLIPWGTYYDKLTLAMAYGGAPDVFIIQAARFPEFASYGTLRPLETLYEKTDPPLTAKQFVPLPWNESFYRGIHYALPLDTHPLGLYYNTALFKAAGIIDTHGNAKPPTSLSEFLADAKKLTKTPAGGGPPTQWGFVFTNEHSNWLTIAHQFGGDIVTPDGKHGAMASPAGLAATHLMCDFIYKDKIAPMPGGISDAWMLFREGKAAMAMEGIYMLNSLQTTQGLQFAGAHAPLFGTQPAVWGGSHLLCQSVQESPARSQAAWRLMQFLSAHSILWGIGGQVPARVSVEQSAAFQALPVQSQFARELSYVHYDPQIPRANALNQFADPAIDDALNRLDTPEHAMQDADRRIDQLLSRP
jgi:multiple sugar transport system substrate-binding protein